jgi:hypothetical protein
MRHAHQRSTGGQQAVTLLLEPSLAGAVSVEADWACRVHTPSRVPHPVKQLRIVTLRFNRGDREWPLNDGRVSDRPPKMPHSLTPHFCFAGWGLCSCRDAAPRTCSHLAGGEAAGGSPVSSAATSGSHSAIASLSRLRSKGGLPGGCVAHEKGSSACGNDSARTAGVLPAASASLSLCKAARPVRVRGCVL